MRVGCDPKRGVCHASEFDVFGSSVCGGELCGGIFCTCGDRPDAVCSRHVCKCDWFDVCGGMPCVHRGSRFVLSFCVCFWCRYRVSAWIFMCWWCRCSCCVWLLRWLFLSAEYVRVGLRVHGHLCDGMSRGLLLFGVDASSSGPGRYVLNWWRIFHIRRGVLAV